MSTTTARTGTGRREPGTPHGNTGKTRGVRRPKHARDLWLTPAAEELLARMERAGGEKKNTGGTPVARNGGRP
jgi:hypothetical protein